MNLERLCFGTYRLSNEQAHRMVQYALSKGITRIDTAQLYKNEEAVIEAIVNRYLEQQSRIFVTTKIHKSLIENSDRDNRSIENSVDIYKSLPFVTTVLLHCPAKNYDIAWDQLQRTGLRCGVSNFSIVQLSSMSPLPYVNQLEISAFCHPTETIQWCQNRKIDIEAHSVLTKGKMFQHPVIDNLSKTRNSHPAQLMTQWCLRKGYIPIFSTSKEEHLDILLSPYADSSSELTELDSLNIFYRTHSQYSSIL